VRPRAFVVPMESLRVPFPTVDETTHVGSVFGGLVGRWQPEGTASTADSAKFGVVVLEAGRLEIYCEVPDTLVNDSAISFDAYLAGKVPEALAFYEDRAFLKGTGVGEPLGALNASAMVQVVKQTNQSAATIVWENVVKMYSRMLPSSLMRAVWVVSPDTFPELATMALSVGTGGAAVWLPDGAGVPQMTLLGRPVVVTEKAQVLGTAGDINFIDFGYYLIGDRQAISASSSEHFKFSSSKIAYKVIERVDGRPWIQSAITPENGGPTLSPYVQTATRA
jgi:HK97 family phage major capsid protein